MTQQTFPGSGGWRSRNFRDNVSIGPDIPILASEKYTVKRTGCTFKAQTPSTGVNEVQTLASSGATAGTFTLAYNGQTTAPLPYTATAAAVQQALQGLSTLGVGNVTVTGGPANSANLVITFVGGLARRNLPWPLTLDKSGLTGGGAAAVTVTTQGSAPNVVELARGTFVIPDPSNLGYYRRYANGDTIVTDGTSPISGFLMESINVAFGDVTEGILISGSLLRARLQQDQLTAAVLAAINGRVTLQ